MLKYKTRQHREMPKTAIKKTKLFLLRLFNYTVSTAWVLRRIEWQKAGEKCRV